MSKQVNDELETRETELQLKGLIYVRALRAAAGAPAKELRRFSTEIGRQRRRLESQGERTVQGSEGDGYV